MDLIAGVAKVWQREQDDAGRRYRELLERAEQPQEGDAVAVAECMRHLGRRPEDLAGDIGLAREMAAAAAAAVEFEATEQDYHDKAKAHQAAAAWAEQRRKEVEAEIAERLKPAEEADLAAHGKVNKTRHMKNQVGYLARRWAAVVSGELHHEPSTVGPPSVKCSVLRTSIHGPEPAEVVEDAAAVDA